MAAALEVESTLTASPPSYSAANYSEPALLPGSFTRLQHHLCPPILALVKILISIRPFVEWQFMGNDPRGFGFSGLNQIA